MRKNNRKDQRNYVFLKRSKIGKLFAGLIGIKRREDSNIIRNRKGDIKTDTT